MTYTKIGTGDYIFSHSSTPAPRTPHNERAAPTLGAAREVVQAEEKKEAVEAPPAQPNVRFPFYVTRALLIYPHLE